MSEKAEESPEEIDYDIWYWNAINYPEYNNLENNKQNDKGKKIVEVNTTKAAAERCHKIDYVNATMNRLDIDIATTRHSPKSVTDLKNQLEILNERVKKLEVVNETLKEPKGKTDEPTQLENEDRVKHLEQQTSKFLQTVDYTIDRVQKLESRLLKTNTSHPNNRGDEGCYINWDSTCHYDHITGFYVSRVEIKQMLWKMKLMRFKSKKDRDQMRKMLNSLTIFKIDRTTRFPIGEECIDIKEGDISRYMKTMYFRLGKQDEIDTAYQLGEEYDTAWTHAGNFYGARNKFELSVDGSGTQLGGTCGRHTVDSFEQAFNLKWQEKQEQETVVNTPIDGTDSIIECLQKAVEQGLLIVKA